MAIIPISMLNEFGCHAGKQGRQYRLGGNEDGFYQSAQETIVESAGAVPQGRLRLDTGGHRRGARTCPTY